MGLYDNDVYLDGNIYEIICRESLVSNLIEIKLLNVLQKIIDIITIHSYVYDDYEMINF